MRLTASTHRVSSFPPQIGPHCRVLVLGTAPSLASLARRESYGHRQNLFWQFMGEMFAAKPDLRYAERIARLHAIGIGIWDVYKQVDRPGSLDSSIVRATEVPNAIAALLQSESTIVAIALNGAKAAEGFRRHIEPTLPVSIAVRVTVLALPSTSPANASVSRFDKLRRWREIEHFVLK